MEKKRENWQWQCGASPRRTSRKTAAHGRSLFSFGQASEVADGAPSNIVLDLTRRVELLFLLAVHGSRFPSHLWSSRLASVFAAKHHRSSINPNLNPTPLVIAALAVSSWPNVETRSTSYGDRGMLPVWESFHPDWTGAAVWDRSTPRAQQRKQRQTTTKRMQPGRCVWPSLVTQELLRYGACAVRSYFCWLYVVQPGRVRVLSIATKIVLRVGRFPVRGPFCRLCTWDRSRALLESRAHMMVVVHVSGGK